MLNGVYSQSDIGPGINYPDTPTDRMLGAVRCVAPTRAFRGAGDGCVGLVIRLPYNCFAQGQLVLPDKQTGYQGALQLNGLFVGDDRLIGSGTGTRLVQAFVAAAVAEQPVPKMHTGWARLGAVNAIVNAMGPDRVRVYHGWSDEDQYGWGAKRPLSALFKKGAVADGRPYKAHAVLVDLLEVQPGFRRDG